MKNLIVLVFALFSLTAFANVDFLVGNYKNSTSEARVIKELVKPADLFEPIPLPAPAIPAAPLAVQPAESKKSPEVKKQ